MMFFAALLKIVFVVWSLLILIMLPIYFYRKRKAPMDKKNTIKRLIIKSFAASLIFTLFMYSGLIAMFFDDIVK